MVSTRQQAIRPDNNGTPDSFVTENPADATSPTSQLLGAIEASISNETPPIETMPPPSIPTATAEATPVRDENQALQEEVERLETKVKLLKRKRELEEYLAQDQAPRPSIELRRSSSNTTSIPTRSRHESPMSGSDSGEEIKVRNIETLKIPTNQRTLDDWVNDLERAFEAAPRKFRKDRNKIALANEYMDRDGRSQWSRHLDEFDVNVRAYMKRDWGAFRYWTEALVKDAGDKDANTMAAMERARQRPGQSPREFHIYLDSLEKHFPRKEEKERALFFLAKLTPPLQAHFKLQAGKLPERREEMVSMATRYWDSMPKEEQPRQSHENIYSNNRRGRGTYPTSNSSRNHGGPAPRPYGRGNYSSSGPNRSTSQQTSDQRNTQVTCYNCNEVGHISPNCPKNSARVQQIQHQGN